MIDKRSNYSAKDVRNAKEFIFFSHNLIAPSPTVEGEENNTYLSDCIKN